MSIKLAEPPRSMGTAFPDEARTIPRGAKTPESIMESVLAGVLV
jgi:hypothetical protein